MYLSNFSYMSLLGIMKSGMSGTLLNIFFNSTIVKSCNFIFMQLGCFYIQG